MNIKLSSCQTFLEVDDMKFMASDETNFNETDECSDCYFRYNMIGGQVCDENYCMAGYRKDNRYIIWIRIE